MATDSETKSSATNFDNRTDENEVNESTLAFERKLERLESQNRNKSQAGENYIFILESYLENLKETKHDKNHLISVYKRAVTNYCKDPELWTKYLNFAAENNFDKKFLFSKYEEAIKNNPDNFELLQKCAFFLERENYDFEFIEKWVEKTLSNSSLNSHMTAYFRLFPAAYLCRKFLATKDAHLVERVRDAFKRIHDFVEKTCGNVLPMSYRDILLYQAFFESTHFKNIQNARECYEKLIKGFPNNVDSWIKYIEFEKNIAGSEVQVMKSLISKAVKKFANSRNKRDIDSINTIWNEVVWYCEPSIEIMQHDFVEIGKFQTDNIQVHKQTRKFGKKEKIGKRESKITENKSNANKENRVLSPGNKDLTPHKNCSDKEDLTVFVVNIAKDVNEKDLDSLFGHYGKIKQIRMPKSNKGNRGFAYVQYKSEESVVQAIKELNNMKFHDMILTVQRSRSNKISKSSVFLKGLPKTDCEEQIRTELEKIGKIVEIRRPTETKQNTKCLKPYCYVTFESEEMAKNARQKEKILVDEKVITVEECLPSQEKQKKTERKNNRSSEAVLVPSSVMKRKINLTSSSANYENAKREK